MGEGGKIGAALGDHGGIVTAAEELRHHYYFDFGKAKHVAQLALPENRHQWIDDCAQPRASEIESNELPPVRQLACDDGTLFRAHGRKADSHTADNALKLTISQGCRLPAHAVVVEDVCLVGMAVHGIIEVVRQHSLRPMGAGPFDRSPSRKFSFSHGARS